jgi:hypothetical protein
VTVRVRVVLIDRNGTPVTDPRPTWTSSPRTTRRVGVRGAINACSCSSRSRGSPPVDGCGDADPAWSLEVFWNVVWLRTMMQSDTSTSIACYGCRFRLLVVSRAMPTYSNSSCRRIPCYSTLLAYLHTPRAPTRPRNNANSQQDLFRSSTCIRLCTPALPRRRDVIPPRASLGGSCIVLSGLSLTGKSTRSTSVSPFGYTRKRSSEYTAEIMNRIPSRGSHHYATMAITNTSYHSSCQSRRGSSSPTG